MSRGGLNRKPEVSQAVRAKALEIPKSEWIELYFDFAREVYGEETTDEAIIENVQRRRKILKASRGK